jgi:type VI protein secretion system component Hcp
MDRLPQREGVSLKLASRARIGFALAVLSLAALGVVVGADHICLVFSGVNGEDTFKGCEKQIEILSVSQGSSTDCAKGGKAGASPLVLTKLLDRSSAALYPLAFTGAPQVSAQIKFFASDGETVEIVRDYTLVNPRVISVAASDSDNGQQQIESVVLGFDELEVRTKDGSSLGDPIVFSVPTCP